MKPCEQGLYALAISANVGAGRGCRGWGGEEGHRGLEDLRSAQRAEEFNSEKHALAYLRVVGNG